MTSYLITGATGSLGSALTLRLLGEPSNKVRAFARNEHGHERLAERVPAHDRPRLSSLIGDVRDRERVRRAMEGVDVVIHAAAMKVIPACEYNPQEAVSTNVDGTRNVAECAIDTNVARAILISTDKARSPVTHYGSCKLAAERLWLGANHLCGPRPHRFAGVVYGNVFGSQGSILHRFRETAKKGYVEITDARCTRFNITLEEAVDFVLRASTHAEPGTLWIPKLPSYVVTHFAQAVAPGAEHRIVGLRANEKVHEVLVSEDEARSTYEENGHLVMRPGTLAAKPSTEYHSGRNARFLTVEDIRRLAEGV